MKIYFKKKLNNKVYKQMDYKHNYLQINWMHESWGIPFFAGNKKKER